jgi:O-antigen ligase
MNLEGRLSFTRTRLDYPILCFLALAVISTLFSIYRHDSLLELYKIINYIAIYYLVVNHLNTRERVKRMALVVVGMGTLLSIIGLIHYLGGRSLSSISSTYVNRNHFAGYLELVIPLSMGMLLMSADKGKKIILGYCAIIMVVALVLTLSRGGWAGLAASLLVMGILLKRRGLCPKRPWVPLSLILVTGLVLAVIGTSPLTNRFSATKQLIREPLDYNPRVRVWKGTLEMIKDHPFLGTGIGTFVTAFPRYRPAGLSGLWIYSHNDYLQTISEMGVFALGIIIWLIFSTLRAGFKTFFRSRSRFRQGISLGATGGIVAILIHSLVDFNLHIPANALLFVVLAAIIQAQSLNQHGPVWPPPIVIH